MATKYDEIIAFNVTEMADYLAKMVFKAMNDPVDLCPEEISILFLKQLLIDDGIKKPKEERKQFNCDNYYGY